MVLQKDLGAKQDLTSGVKREGITRRREMEVGGRLRRGGGNASLIAVVLLLAMSRCQAWDCSAVDKAILLNFKDSFVDNAGVFASWSLNSTNCCTWPGVTCRETDGAVLELAVVGSSAANQQPYRDSSFSEGTVGAGLVGLTQLQKLKIQWVLFNGGIPQVWGAFSDNLIWITINNANLRGDIPSALANIDNLQRLDLKSNHLDGDIPSAFCLNPSINYIDVSYNDMDLLPVPACLRNVTILYNSQGQSTSPGTPSAGSLLTVTSSAVLAFGALSSALLVL